MYKNNYHIKTILKEILNTVKYKTDIASLLIISYCYCCLNNNDEFIGLELEFNNLLKKKLNFNSISEIDIIKNDNLNYCVSILINNLGYLYENNKDFDKAIHYYFKGIELSDGSSAHNLGCFYENNKDFEKAIHYYLKGIELGNGTSAYNLGCFYENNEDFEKAIHYYLEGIELGNGSSANNLGDFYEKNKDFDKAICYYLKGIELGDGFSANSLGLLYKRNGDMDKAIYYYLKGVELNNLDSLINLRDIYNNNIFNKELLKYENIIYVIELIYKNNIDDDYSEYFICLLKSMYEKNYIDYNYVIDISNLKKKYCKKRKHFITIDHSLLAHELGENKQLKEKIKHMEEYIKKLELLPLGNEYKKLLEEFQFYEKKMWE
jgi:tetratricopeptide (TPR) repeat protein